MLLVCTILIGPVISVILLRFDRTEGMIRPSGRGTISTDSF
jgi:hypothetical protein